MCIIPLRHNILHSRQCARARQVCNTSQSLVLLFKLHCVLLQSAVLAFAVLYYAMQYCVFCCVTIVLSCMLLAELFASVVYCEIVSRCMRYCAAVRRADPVKQ